MPGFYEFFAGGGMVRAGLGHGWDCLFANDFDARKGLTYQANWGTGGELTVGDIHDLEAAALPGNPDLVWGSFPCQDLSLAGNGAGLAGQRSGTFYAFWSLVRGLADQGRAPRIVAVENVCGALSHAAARTLRPCAGPSPRLGTALACWSSTRTCSCPSPAHVCSSWDCIRMPSFLLI